jgi:hypothetical protein
MSNYPPQPGSLPPGPQQPFPAQPGYPPGSEPYPPPRAGMGCGMKILIALGVCFLLLLILCCGGGYMVSKSFKPITAPKEIDAMTREMTDIDIPARLEPTGGIDMRLPLVNKTLMRFAVYSDKNSNEEKASNLILMAMGDFFAGQNQDQIRQSINDSFNKSTGRQNKQEKLQNEQHSTIDRTIRGEKVTFTVVKGTGAVSHVPRMRVQGVFPGKAGMVMLLLDANTDKLPEKEIDEMIESIR